MRKPVEGAMKDGFEGFAKGVAQGVIGVAVKPVAGSRTFYGMQNSLTVL